MTTEQVRPRRIEPAAVSGVLFHQWIVFMRFWRSRTFSAIVEPIFMLVAFGFGFGKLVSTVAGIPYLQFVGTGIVATAVLFSAIFSGMFDTLYKRRYMRIYDAMLATPIDVEEIVTGEVLFLGVRAGIYGVVPLLVAIAFGLPAAPAMVLVPLVGVLTGLGFAALGVVFASVAQTFDGLSYVVSGVVTPLFLLAGSFFPLTRMPEWLRVAAQGNPLYHCVQLVRDCAFGLHPGADLVHAGALALFALIALQLAIWRMRARLIT